MASVSLREIQDEDLPIFFEQVVRKDSCRRFVELFLRYIFSADPCLEIGKGKNIHGCCATGRGEGKTANDLAIYSNSIRQ